MRYASFFTGVGGFEAALGSAGAECVYACEIDQFCRDVFKARFGFEPQGRDINLVKPEDIPDADAWVGGWPCTDVSVAGKRGGIHAARSGLFWTMMRLVAARRPRFLKLENVPGLLSSGEAGDFHEVLDALNDAGYVVDPDICDAQHFGVPQRRRRVFFVCERLDMGLAARSDLVLRGMAMSVVDTARLAFRELLNRFGGWPTGSNMAELERAVAKRSGFYYQRPGRDIWRSLPAELMAGLRGWAHDCDAMRCRAPIGWGRSTVAAPDAEPQAKCVVERKWETEVLSAWTSILPGTSGDARLPASPRRAEALLYDCARTILLSGAQVLASRGSCPRWAEVCGAAHAALMEVDRYARVAGEDIFGSMDGREGWRLLHEQAQGCLVALRGLGAAGGPEVLPDSEGGAGDHPQGVQEGTRPPAQAAGRPRAAGGPGAETEGEEGEGSEKGADCARTVVASPNDVGAGKGDLVGPEIASPVTASAGHHGHSSPRGDVRDNLVASTLSTNHKPDRGQRNENIVAGTLQSCGEGQGRKTPEVDQIVSPGVEPVNDKAYTVAKASGGGLGGRDGQDDYILIREEDAEAGLASDEKPVGSLTAHTKRHGHSMGSGQAAEEGHLITTFQDGATAFHRNASCNVADQKGFVGIPVPAAAKETAPCAAPIFERTGGDTEAARLVQQPLFIDAWAARGSSGPNQNPVKSDRLSDCLDGTAPGAVALEAVPPAPIVAGFSYGDRCPLCRAAVQRVVVDGPGFRCEECLSVWLAAPVEPVILAQNGSSITAYTKGEPSPTLRDGHGVGAPSVMVPCEPESLRPLEGSGSPETGAFNIVGSGQRSKSHAYQTDGTGALQSKGNPASGNEAGTVIMGPAAAPKAFRIANTPQPGVSEDVMPTLQAKAGKDGGPRGGAMDVVGFYPTAGSRSVDAREDQSPPVKVGSGKGGSPPAVAAGDARQSVPMMERRLTPTETERLQGFPDGWTCLCQARPECPDRRVPPWIDISKMRLGGCGHSICGCSCPDSRRYRATGNSVAVPCVRWIGERLIAASQLLEDSP